jgi:CRP-like cAMP-binding protein
MHHNLILSSISKHVTLSNADVGYIEKAFKLKKFKKRDIVLQTGDRCKYDYFVNSGCLRSYFHDADEKEHTITFAVGGWWTGNMKSLYTGSPSLFSIDAMQDSEVLCITRSALEELYETVPALNKFFRIILKNNVIATQDRVINHLSLSAETRYDLFVKKFPGLEQMVDQKIIASYLGITPAYLSRLRRRRMRNTN